ncbi:sigma-70 family RNA polymerase sigma factor [Bacillus alkalicellulosilyticus]|uniref:sigma-70 family RNA polymerase sigma factor n=1 Tax=Alkalihalobacterium alkalicellulosilyticum TaxID=1912214 RepID=UPI000997ED2B|nr:sigma-70 family RNA polymerase sigma factor [Bacillus alkalicellulosilyticus]
MQINERNFIEQLQNQNEDALSYIVDRYLPLVKGMTNKILAPLSNKGLIEECTNDIFLSIWNHALKFKGNNEIEFKKWVFAIAKFKAIDYYRMAKNQKEISSDVIAGEGNKSAEDELLLMESRTELVNLLNHLSPVDRNIFIMKYLLGMKTDDIAEKLSMTTSAIANRLHRGKKELHELGKQLTLGEKLG